MNLQAIAHKLHPEERKFAFNAELLFWAHKYIQQGLPIFPTAVIRGRKRPLVKIGRGDAHGSLASTDWNQIKVWWTKWPMAMIGMPTGKPSGLCVLDVDVKNGVDGFKTMRDNGWELPANTVEVKTPSGGSHFYFRMPEMDLRCSAGVLGPGLDIRANGGIIILPPSRPALATGYDYHYAEGQDCEAGRLVW